MMEFDNDTDWATSVLEAQKKYLETVNQYYTWLQQNTDDRNRSNQTWLNFLEQCNQAIGASVPREAYPVFNNLLHQTTLLNSFYHQFQSLFTPAGSGSSSYADWFDTYRNYIQGMSRDGIATNDTYRDIHNSVNQVQEYWQEYMQVALQDTPIAGHMANLDKLFAGITTTDQQDWTRTELEELAHMWHDYQQALNQYQVIMISVNINAIELFCNKLTAVTIGGNKISSLRELYNLWVDCQEEAYRNMAFTDNYARSYAALVNSSMLLKQKLDSLSEQTIEMLTQSPEQKVSKVMKKQTEIYNELQESREELQKSQVKIDELTRELDELRNMMNTDAEKPTDEDTE